MYLLLVDNRCALIEPFWCWYFQTSSATLSTFQTFRPNMNEHTPVSKALTLVCETSAYCGGIVEYGDL